MTSLKDSVFLRPYCDTQFSNLLSTQHPVDPRPTEGATMVALSKDSPQPPPSSPLAQSVLGLRKPTNETPQTPHQMSTIYAVG